ncbi:sugar ABC transporter substrate-binding protein [Dactylosporangium sp. CA-139066]|uniref:sugar ABC transporter substrate-binding protein n=1 Tax=Dactylosporangium sp. CA-139066 TaxID=3239930 RepID=UPI003D8D18C5
MPVVGVLTALLSTAGCTQSVESAPPASHTVRIGFITKFPGDFYDTMVGAVRQYDTAHDDVEVVFGQGKSGTDDESAIGFVDDMIAKKVNAIAITPTSPNVQSALDKAIAHGIKVVLVDNDIPAGPASPPSWPPTTSPAAGWPGPGSPGGSRAARRWPCCRAGSATRRWTTGSPA